MFNKFLEKVQLEEDYNDVWQKVKQNIIPSYHGMQVTQQRTQVGKDGLTNKELVEHALHQELIRTILKLGKEKVQYYYLTFRKSNTVTYL